MSFSMPIIPFYVIPCELTLIILIGCRYQPLKLHSYSLSYKSTFSYDHWICPYPQV